MAERHDPHAAEHEHGPEHVHGEMNIEEHEAMFGAFIRFWVLVFGVSIGILVFLALFNS